VKFTETPLVGAFIVEIEPRPDERGFFARTACVDEFSAAGLNGEFVQQSISWNPHRGTLRGLHFQVTPGDEDKLVRVTRGAVFDVIVDLRAASLTRGQWFSAELSADNRRQVYVPRGFAHGFQTLTADTEVFYEMTGRFAPDTARGIRWNDPDIAIDWPPADRLIGTRDLQLPMLADSEVSAT